MFKVRSIFVLLSSFLFSELKAQLLETPSNNIIYGYCYTNISPYTVSYGLITYKDTVINSLPIKFFSNGQMFYNTNGKVYLYDPFQNPYLILIYDYTLSTVGDTISVPGFWGSVTHLQVDTVGVITMLAGQQRKYLVLHDINNPSTSVKWVEGIGDLINGFDYYKYDGYCSYFYPVCESDSTGMLYEGDTCVISATSSADELSENPIHVSFYPNPANEELNVTIESSNERAYSISISTLLGEEAYSSKADASEKIKVRNLTSGLYVIKVIDDKGHICYSDKMIIQH